LQYDWRNYNNTWSNYFKLQVNIWANDKILFGKIIFFDLYLCLRMLTDGDKFIKYKYDVINRDNKKKVLLPKRVKEVKVSRSKTSF